MTKTHTPGRFDHRGSLATLYISRDNPYRRPKSPMHSIVPTITLSDQDLKAWLWHQFETFEVIALATLVNDASRALVPVGYRFGNNVPAALASMVTDGTLTTARQGGYLAYRRA